MAKFDKKKYREEQLLKQKEAEIVAPYSDFEGTKTELFFLKLSDFMARNRFKVFICIIVLILILSAVAGIGEYMRYSDNKATMQAESLERKWEKNPAITNDEKIQDMEKFLTEHSSKNTTMLFSKRLADAYIEKKDFAKAATYFEQIVNSFDEPKEMKAYYSFLAGNAKENSKDFKSALNHYARAANLLNNNREASSFLAWSLYSTARMKLQDGQTDAAKMDLKKILDIEDKPTGGPYLNDVKQLATYLILKINKG